VILLDTNILMYAGGGLHTCKAPSLRLLRRVAAGEVAAAVNAEVLQEILHRFQGSPRWADGVRMYELTRQVVSVVIPVTETVLDGAVRLMQRHPALSARDAVHASTALAVGVRGICSYDTDLDQVVGLRRFVPDEL
jgi:predicted nucleic acid-binding protein